MILASGQSVRYGPENKLLAPCDGQPLYTWVLDAVPEETFEKIVLVTAHEGVRRDAERRGARVIMNRQPEEGIAASVRLGTAEMLGMDGCLYCVADQPYMSTASLRRLAAGFTGGIRTLGFEERQGNPALFGRKYYPELLALEGDRGGGAVIRRYQEVAELIEADCVLELMDVDTPRDLHALGRVRNLLLTGSDRKACRAFLKDALKQGILAVNSALPDRFVLMTDTAAAGRITRVLDAPVPSVGLLPPDEKTARHIRGRHDTRVVRLEKNFPMDACRAVKRFKNVLMAYSQEEQGLLQRRVQETTRCSEGGRTRETDRMH